MFYLSFNNQTVRVARFQIGNEVLSYFVNGEWLVLSLTNINEINVRKANV